MIMMGKSICLIWVNNVTGYIGTKQVVKRAWYCKHFQFSDFICEKLPVDKSYYEIIF